MNNSPQCYRITVGRNDFMAITTAIMTQSMVDGKLRGFGQAVTRWLDQVDNTTALQDIPCLISDDLTADEPTFLLYLSVPVSSGEQFRRWRTLLAERRGERVSVASSTATLARMCLNRHKSVIKSVLLWHET